MQRRLTTILAADVAGYSRLMGADEAGTLAALKAHRAELIEPKTRQYGGRTVKLMGDGQLMEFASVVEAVRFAVEVQCAMRARNEDVPPERRIELRIGINAGDIILDAGDVYGDGVNIAARLEALAEPGGICVRRNVRNQVRDKLDLGFEDLGEIEVKNIARPVRVFRVILDERAERLVTPVTVPASRLPRVALAAAVALAAGLGLLGWWQPWAPREAPASVERMAFALPEKPSIAVLPFETLGGESEADLFADAVTTDIITDLSRFGDLFVIASDSSFAVREASDQAARIAERLGVRYVLRGTIQSDADRIRVNARLTDAITGRHVWAERYERESTALMRIQGEIVQSIVVHLAARIDQAELKRALASSTESLGAYGHYWRGRNAYFKWTREDNAEARAHLEKAIMLDPSYRQAHAWLAWAHANDARYAWSDDPARSSNLALEAAQRAVELDPAHYESQWTLGHVYILTGEFERGMAAYERALALNPNDANLLANYAHQLVGFGRAEEAVERVRAAIRLNPYHPSWYGWILAYAQYFAGDAQGALETIRRMPEPPNSVRRVTAAALVRLGRLEEARAEMAAFVKAGPDMGLAQLKKLPFRHRPYLDRWVTDLRAAGMPE